MYYPREIKEQIYFGIFISCWVLLIYLMNFQELFMYRMFQQINDIQKKPLYDLSVFIDKHEDDTINQFNLMLLQNQGSRCGKCNNFILPKDSKYTALTYKVPLHEGGTNHHENLMVVCPNCNTPFY
tara:strand:+ start:77 stop:454 length:378 start_codon:yes stop_codon:yes gene_type:complete